jgi:hypothetical protein
MRIFITLLAAFFSLHATAQTKSYLATAGKKDLHYVALSGEQAIVYKMGTYMHKGGSGKSITLTDTLLPLNLNEYKGKVYTLIRKDTSYTLSRDNGSSRYKAETEYDIKKVNRDLNNAYFLESHFKLCDRLATEFPLHHYSYVNAYWVWNDLRGKSMDHEKFMKRTDTIVTATYDSISRQQIAFTRTMNFILDHASSASYSTLKDSISTLPITWRVNDGYFDKAANHLSKTNPEYFYKLLQDFPQNKDLVYSSVSLDPQLVNQLKNVQGYDSEKKEFIKDRNYSKRMPYQIAGMYLLVAGVLTWLIVAQP